MRITSFKDYLFTELVLSLSYSPSNFYCFVLDEKATRAFKGAIRNLPKCFSNIFVVDQEFRVDSFGRNAIAANLACLRLMLNVSWQYALLLQVKNTLCASFLLIFSATRFHHEDESRTGGDRQIAQRYQPYGNVPGDDMGPSSESTTKLAFG
jgi:hypothetical protein